MCWAGFQREGISFTATGAAGSAWQGCRLATLIFGCIIFLSRCCSVRKRDFPAYWISGSTSVKVEQTLDNVCLICSDYGI